VVGALVVGSILLGALWAAGIGPFARPAATRSGATFQQAARTAVTRTAAAYPGPWIAVGGAGVHLVTAARWNLTAFDVTAHEALNCGTTVGVAGSEVSVPATAGSPWDGIAGVWQLVLTNGSALQYVLVTGNSVVPLWSLSLSVCYPGVQVTFSDAAADIDSSAAATTAGASGGTAFEARYSAVDGLYELEPSVGWRDNSTTVPAGLNPSQWLIGATDCDLSDPNGSTFGGAPSQLFVDAAWASNGSGPRSQNLSVPCPSVVTWPLGVWAPPIGTGSPGGRPPVGTALAFGPIAESSWGNASAMEYGYNTTVETAQSGMVWAEVDPELDTPAGGSLAGDIVAVTVTNGAGSCLEASYDVGVGWEAPNGSAVCTGPLGGSAPIEAGALLSLVTSTSLAGQGDSLVFLGAGEYSGEIVASIP